MLTLGRRRTALIAHVLAILDSAICMIGNTPCLTFGRLLGGISAGILNVVFGKMITENMPERLASKFAMAHNASVCIGFIPCFLMGAFLPDPTDFEGNKEDELWRIIFLMPALISIVSILLITLVYNLEPIAYCIMIDDGE